MVAALVAGLLFDGDLENLLLQGSFSSQAEARIGRPATPLSYAGVARRTTHRMVRRSAIYVAALPRGCVTITISGAALWQCGASYYQAYGPQYVVVYVD